MFSSRSQFAAAMLIHNKRRFLLSLSAIAFAVLIMFMELGFFNGINDSQSLLPARLKADLVMMDTKSVHLNKFSKMSRIRLNQALSFDAVVEAIPIYKENVRIKNPRTERTKIIFLLAFPPDSDPFDLRFSDGCKDELKKGRTILFDEASREIFGRIEMGDDLELNGDSYRVGGFFELGPNFSNDGTILMGETNWLRGKVHGSAARVTYGLLRLKPGTDVQAMKKILLEGLPPDILLLTPEEMRQREVSYTIKAVPIGAIFGVGLVIGFIIGTIICYQLLYNEIVDHMDQYATLKAMGFSDRFLKGVVIREALILSFLGFLPGAFFANSLYSVIQASTGIIMFLSAARVGLIFCLTVIMCILAGMIAVKQVTSSDPAELF